MTPLVMVLVASGLALRIETPQTHVLVGEPLKLTVRWRAAGSTELKVTPELADFTQQTLAFRVHDGSSERTYVEASRGGDTIGARLALAPGQEFGRNLVLLRGGYPSNTGMATVPTLLFGKPGEYRLRVEHLGDPAGDGDGSVRGVLSNEIRVQVSAPRGPDAEILAFSERNRLVLDATGASVEQNNETAALMERYPESPYLRWTKLRSIYFKSAQGAGSGNRQAMSALRKSDPVAYRRQVQLFYLELAREVLAFANWGPFEEDAMAQAYSFARSAGDEDLMRETRGRLLAAYPRSPYAEDVQPEEESASTK